jgi:hypothetical protein
MSSPSEGVCILIPSHGGSCLTSSSMQTREFSKYKGSSGPASTRVTMAGRAGMMVVEARVTLSAATSMCRNSIGACQPKGRVGAGGPPPGPLGPAGAPLSTGPRPPMRPAAFGPPSVAPPHQNGPVPGRGPPMGPGGMPGGLPFRPPPPGQFPGPPGAAHPGIPQGPPPTGFPQAPGMPQALPRPGFSQGPGVPQGLPPPGFPNGPGVGMGMAPPPLAAPQFGGGGGMRPPPPMRPAPGFQQPVGQAGAFDAMQSRVLDQFEALSIGPAGPGQPMDMSADPATYPHPVGPQAEAAGAAPPPPFEGNCEPRFMRLTVNAMPTQQVWTFCGCPGRPGSWPGLQISPGACNMCPVALMLCRFKPVLF